MSSIADITQYLEPRPRLADIDAAAKALLFSFEMIAPAAVRIEKTARLLYAFGDEDHERLMSHEEAAASLISSMNRIGLIDAGQANLLAAMGYLTMQHFCTQLHAGLDISKFKLRETARLYVVVLCLARLGDGAAIH